MGKRLPVTPASRATSMLRRLWMWSRERAAALKRAGRRCEQCGSRERIEVHHLRPANFKRIIAVIREELLVAAEHLVVLCRECHDRTHRKPCGKGSASAGAPDAKSNGPLVCGGRRA